MKRYIFYLSTARGASQVPLPDWMIEKYSGKSGMIDPFNRERLSSYGYDMTLDRNFLIPKMNYRSGVVVDPKHVNPRDFQKYRGVHVTIPPSGFVLGKSKEYFRIPRNILAICLGRSTYARCGIITNVTPLEPEWEGFVTIEISNTNHVPARVYADEGISQVVFLDAQDVCKVSYAEKGGVYQKQTDITLPRMNRRSSVRTVSRRTRAKS